MPSDAKHKHAISPLSPTTEHTLQTSTMARTLATSPQSVNYESQETTTTPRTHAQHGKPRPSPISISSNLQCTTAVRQFENEEPRHLIRTSPPRPHPSGLTISNALSYKTSPLSPPHIKKTIYKWQSPIPHKRIDQHFTRYTREKRSGEATQCDRRWMLPSHNRRQKTDAQPSDRLPRPSTKKDNGDPNPANSTNGSPQINPEELKPPTPILVMSNDTRITALSKSSLLHDLTVSREQNTKFKRCNRQHCFMSKAHYAFLRRHTRKKKCHRQNKRLYLFLDNKISLTPKQKFYASPFKCTCTDGGPTVDEI